MSHQKHELRRKSLLRGRDRDKERHIDTDRHTVTDRSREQGKVDCQEKGGEQICLPNERKGEQKDGSREGLNGGQNKRTDEVRIDCDTLSSKMSLVKLLSSRKRQSFVWEYFVNEERHHKS